MRTPLGVLLVLLLPSCSRCMPGPPPRVWPDLTKLGAWCSGQADCPAGIECMKGGAFAGPSPGSTCELACSDAEEPERRCPPGLSCAITSDGPGNHRFRCQRL